jgi:hypothetical protein
MKRVILESPYAGNVEENVAYARRCMRDCIERLEAPFASHLLYTQPGILNDNKPVEREAGICAGLNWGVVAEATVVYIDKGITDGMLKGIRDAREKGRPVIYRSLHRELSIEVHTAREEISKPSKSLSCK